MPEIFYTASLIAVLAVVSISVLISSHLLDVKSHAPAALRIFQLYFISGFSGWLFYALIEFAGLAISLSWLAIAYFLAASLLIFILTNQVIINTTNTIWLLSNAIFILFELLAETLETQLWIFSAYVLIHLTYLSFIAIKSPLFSSNVGYKIIALAVIIPLFFGISQVYLLLNQHDLHVVVGVGLTGAATSYSLVALGFMTMMLILERDLYAIQAHNDALTGLYNRRGLYNLLAHVVAECERDSKSLGVVVCDIDFFKKINDFHGHDTGDMVLKHFSDLLKKAARGGDIVARMGGEEFIICLPRSDIDESRQFAERTRKLVENMQVATKNEIIKLTASFGVASQPDNIDIDLLIKAADKALYEAKTHGRNCVYTANENA